MRAELQEIWVAYASAAGDHTGWRTGAVYLRESKREQVEGFSPAAQLKGTLDEASRRLLWVPVEHVFLDLMSGRREDRVAFQDLLALARTGTIAAVIVLHTSRWARNAMVSRKYKDELRRRGVDVVATNAPFDVARPEGKFAERMMEAVDEFTSDTIGWWVGVGLREKHERGEPLGRLPETFYRDPAGAVLPHPELSTIVLEGAHRYATGRVGFGELARWSSREGFRTPAGRSLTDEWWRNVLANPLNAGLVGYRRKRGGKELRRAAFAGFMPLDLFERVQATRRARVRLPKRSANRSVYPLTEVTRCACGGRVTASSKRRMRCRRASEHAGCSEPSVAAERIEAQLGVWLRLAMALPTSLRPRVAALVRARVSQQRDGATVETLRVAVKRLTDAYMWKALDEADYREQLGVLQAQLERAEQAPDERRILQAIKVAQDLGTAWESASPERRCQVLRTLFDSVTVSRQAIVAVRPKPDVAPLLAAKVQSGGPDRGLTRGIERSSTACSSEASRTCWSSSPQGRHDRQASRLAVHVATCGDSWPMSPPRTHRATPQRSLAAVSARGARRQWAKRA